MYASLPKEEVGDLPLLCTVSKSRRFGVGRCLLRFDDWRDEVRDFLRLTLSKSRRFGVGLLRRDDRAEDVDDLRRADVLRRTGRDVCDNRLDLRREVRGVDAFRTRALISATSLG